MRIFELAIPTPETARWDLGKAPRPDVVIVALGTNDLQGGGGKPLDLEGLADDLLRTRLEHVVARRTSAGDRSIELVQVPNQATHGGCGFHPDAEMNGRIADRLAAVVRSRLPR